MGYAAYDPAPTRDHILTLNAGKSFPYTVYSTSIATDSSGVQVGVSDPDKARRLARRSNGPASEQALSATTPNVPITFTKGALVEGAAWRDVKWHDTTPFIGGDVITDGNEYCSAGLPAIRNSDGATVMVTADHCFKNGAQVYTGNGTPGALTGSTGNWVGQRTSATQEFDAEILVGTNNNADESDTDGWKPLTRYAYSYNGDYVCQDGGASFFDYHNAGTSPTPCNIKVANEDVTWKMNDAYGTEHDTRGVKGQNTSSSNSKYAVCQGDSGGTVFTAVNSDWSASAREARGIVSAQDGAPCSTNIYWTEATDIFNRLGLHLNPTT
ncbi:hypothetical protein [Actinoallomurus sp. NPDC050550]|uniref:hypothetical protein n=1 Tax=Actinoallomurus sp. NPDC050550 TaxID=3154937 RepID=UPI0033F1A16C